MRLLSDPSARCGVSRVTTLTAREKALGIPSRVRRATRFQPWGLGNPAHVRLEIVRMSYVFPTGTQWAQGPCTRLYCPAREPTAGNANCRASPTWPFNVCSSPAAELDVAPCWTRSYSAARRRSLDLVFRGDSVEGCSVVGARLPQSLR